MKILNWFGLVKLRELDQAQSELRAARDLNESSKLRLEISEMERLSLLKEKAELSEQVEQHKRASAVLATAVKRLHPVIQTVMKMKAIFFLLLFCNSAFSQIWKNSWSTNHPPMLILGDDNLGVTNRLNNGAHIGWWLFTGNTSNTVARLGDVTNIVNAVGPGGGGETNWTRASSTLTPTASSDKVNAPNVVTAGGIVTTNGVTNLNLSASTVIKSDANKKEASIANGTGALTNNNAGGFGWYDLANLAPATGGNYIAIQSGKGNNNTFTNPAVIGTLTIGAGSLQDNGGILEINPSVQVDGNLSVASGQANASIDLGFLSALFQDINTGGNLLIHAPGVKADGWMDAAGVVTNEQSLYVGGFASAVEGNIFLFDGFNFWYALAMYLDDSDLFLIGTNSIILRANGNQDLVWTGIELFGGPNADLGVSVPWNKAGIKTNVSPVVTVTAGGLHAATVGKGWTNDLGGRADLILQVKFTDQATGAPKLAFTNTVTGEGWTNTIDFGIAANPIFNITVPDLSPNDTGKFTDVSTGTGASVQILQAWWKVK